MVRIGISEPAIVLEITTAVTGVWAFGKAPLGSLPFESSPGGELSLTGESPFGGAPAEEADPPLVPGELP